MLEKAKCPVTGGKRAHANRDWWPNQLDLSLLHQHSRKWPAGAAIRRVDVIIRVDRDPAPAAHWNF